MYQRLEYCAYCQATPHDGRMFNSILGKLMTRDESEGLGSTPPGSDSSTSDIDDVLESIERSRKRHLSPGILRGDRISDLLVSQESSASPDFKKARSDLSQRTSVGGTESEKEENMAMSMDAFEKYMENKVIGRLAGLEEGQSDMKTVLAKTNKAVKVNTAKLERHASLIKANADAIAEMRAASASPAPPATVQAEAAETVRTLESETRKIPGFDNARRSLRLWPITGKSNLEMWQSTRVFIRDFLKLADLPESKIQEIARPAHPSGFMTRDEALVRFADSEARDTVLGASAQLSGFFEGGRPTAGIRLEIPKELTTSFKILEKYGQQLRRRHGQGLKRHVRFDDADQSLYLRVKLPGDVQWSRIPIEVARRGVQARDKIYSEEVEKRMDISGPPAVDDRPRPASTSSAGASGQWRGPAPQPMQQ